MPIPLLRLIVGNARLQLIASLPSWPGHNLDSLFTETRMPADAPDTLFPARYSDILACLGTHGLPARMAVLEADRKRLLVHGWIPCLRGADVWIVQVALKRPYTF